MHPRNHTVWVVAAIASIFLAGCKGGGGGESSAVGSPPPSGPTGGGNNRPTISGQPSPTVFQGAPYGFQPTASDSDGNPLTFTASNLPAWLVMNSNSGRISGTPTSADVGTHAGITITVSDGTLSAVLGPFSITVSPTVTGSASLSWVAPQSNTDGTALNDLAGYVVLYGVDPNGLALSVSINNPSVSRHVIENLAAGTWYFAVQAVNSTGARSPLSGTASKTI